jgi:protein dithiol:quinone oxidoreductase
MAYALYEQHVVGLEPCHLCILQRVAVIGLFAVFTLAAAHNPGRLGARVYAGLAVLVALAGMVVAGRQVWIQHLPEGSIPSCGADISFMLKVLPLREVLVKVFEGSGECQKIDWTLFGLSMPAWVFFALTLLGILGVYASMRARSR